LKIEKIIDKKYIFLMN